ncbi:MAG: S49 family peptidase [Rhodospirillales bacterium]|nr:S49 family peptidase [Rhodospirillales bacterium]MCB9994828.1 S49 family peptidase [Rhodospirillales bacterium]
MPNDTLAGVQTRLPHIAARLFEEPLLMHPRKLQTVVNVLAPRLFADLTMTEDMRLAAQDDYLSSPSTPLDPGLRSIAMIPIHGTLVQRGDSLDAASGLLSYEAIREDFDEAMERGDIDAVLFDIDSGGGEAAGVFDLVDYIASRRDEKPVYAFINEHAYSAAYAIASAAEKIFLPRTGGAGSIGVVAVHLDQSGFDEKTGLQYTPVFAGARKIDGWPHAALSQEAQDRIQNRVDMVYGVFTETVAKHRGLPESKVIATEADCFDGQEAVKTGLADGIATFEEVIESLLADLEQRKAAQVSGLTARESTSGQSGVSSTLTKGKKTMALKNLVLGRNRRAVKSQDDPDEDETLIDPNEDEEAQEEDQEENLQDDDEDESLIDDEDDENLEDDDEDESLEDEDEQESAYSEGREAARKEMLEISSLCKLYGKPELAETYLRKGYSAKQVRKRLLAKRNRELKASSQTSVISTQQSARRRSGSGRVVAAVKHKLGMKE